MCINKKNNIIKKFRLSEDAVVFIEKFVLRELKLTTAINSDIMDKIIELATQWELNMIDSSTENYQDKKYDYPERERDMAADKFVTEITGQWDEDNSVLDFDDLNERLKLPN